MPEVRSEGTAPVESRGSPGGQQLSLSDNLSSEEKKGASDPMWQFHQSPWELWECGIVRYYS